MVGFGIRHEAHGVNSERVKEAELQEAEVQKIFLMT